LRLTEVPKADKRHTFRSLDTVPDPAEDEERVAEETEVKTISVPIEYGTFARMSSARLPAKGKPARGA
jgi:hypothetical protein